MIMYFTSFNSFAHRTGTWIAVMLCMMVIGCADSQRVTDGQFGPIAFPGSRATPRVEVLGGLDACLMGVTQPSGLEEFLYGPGDEPPAMLRNPQGMTLAGDRLIVCDQGRLDVVAVGLESGVRKLLSASGLTSRCPVDAAYDESHRIYIADTTLRSVLVYGDNGTMGRSLRPVGLGENEFRPASVAVGGNTLFVGNLAANRIERFNIETGTWLDAWRPHDGAGRLAAPTGLAVMPNGSLLVVDSLSSRVFALDQNGATIDTIGRAGRGEGEFVRPKQVCCTPSGIILVTDAGRQSVLVFDADFRFVTEVFGGADGWDGWTLPAGLQFVGGDQMPDSLLECVEDSSTAYREFVVVSDSMGGPSLTLLAIVTDFVGESGGTN